MLYVANANKVSDTTAVPLMMGSMRRLSAERLPKRLVQSAEPLQLVDPLPGAE